MSDILGLTSFDQLRGVLTVSRADVPDAMLTPYALEDDLTVDLEAWLDDWVALRDGGGREATLLKLYAKYRCAAWLAGTAGNFLLTQYTDGANAGQRADPDVEALLAHLEGRAGHYRQALDEALDSAPTAVGPRLMGRVTPLRDPVTEGR